jgi:rfaE bifunctional protein nucleotidyltransferase chain/domain
MGLVVHDHEELARRVRALRDGGKRVVFTNGCFDVLHVGHVRCLTDAATRGDFLVVAINSDASVRKLKGPDRPVQPAAERAEILCAITGVSYVTFFDEPTVGPLLRKLRPQIVAKGTDYDHTNLPERDVVAEIGAELAIVGDPKKHSTIKLLERIRSGKGVSGGGGAGSGGATASGAKTDKASAKTAKNAGGKKAGGKPAKPASKSQGKALVERVLAAKTASARKKTRSASEAHA